ncbi:MAG: SocA family protein [Erythrobacter sp.]|nr:SocA family protein [Erythrobacter sp.]
MKLQKLVYLCYGWWLVEHDESVIGEAPQVWKHGPVFRSLYQILRDFGHAQINTMQRRMFNETPDRVDDGDIEALDLIDWVWERYGRYDQFQLSDMTHQPNTPWYQTAANHNFRVPMNTEIPLPTIQEHFRAIAAERGFTGAQ